MYDTRTPLTRNKFISSMDLLLLIGLLSLLVAAPTRRGMF
jgi:hypothetical protein